MLTMAASDKEKHQPEKKKKPKTFSNTEILYRFTLPVPDVSVCGQM